VLITLFDVHKKLIEHYGIRKRVNKTISEFAELGVALKDNLAGADNLDEVTEEISDCYNMLDDMVVAYGIAKETIDNIKLEKLKRTLKRLNLPDTPIDKGGKL
jgi:hypothetical protein